MPPPPLIIAALVSALALCIALADVLLQPHQPTCLRGDAPALFTDCAGTP